MIYLIKWLANLHLELFEVAKNDHKVGKSKFFFPRWRIQDGVQKISKNTIFQFWFLKYYCLNVRKQRICLSCSLLVCSLYLSAFYLSIYWYFIYLLSIYLSICLPVRYDSLSAYPLTLPPIYLQLLNLNPKLKKF